MRARYAVAALLFVAVRAALIVTAPLAVISAEEVYMGTVSREFLAGPAFQFLDYQYDPYTGGTLVMGLCGVPVFAAIGHRFVALKATALIWSLVTFLVWLGLIDRTLGRRAVAPAATIWIFAPLAYQQLSVTPWGAHMESLLFTGLTYLIFLSARHAHRDGDGLLRFPDRPPNVWTMAVAGVIAGFSLYFAYTSVIGLAALAIVWCAADRRPLPRRGLVPFLSGLAVGFAPWLIYNIPRQFAGLTLYVGGLHEHFLSPNWRRLPGRLLDLVRHDLPASLAPTTTPGLIRTVGTIAIAAVVVGCFAVAVTRALKSLRRRPSAAGLPPLLLYLPYPLLFTAIWVVSDRGVLPESTGSYAYRYFSTLLPFAAAAVGAALAPHRWPRLVLLAPVGAVVAGLAVTGRDPRFDGPRWRDYRGYSYRWLGITMAKTADSHSTQIDRVLKIADRADRQFALEGLSRSVLRERMDRSGAASPAAIRQQLDWIATQAPAARAPLESALASELSFRSLAGRLPPLGASTWADLVVGRGDPSAWARTAAFNFDELTAATAYLEILPEAARAAGFVAVGEWLHHRRDPRVKLLFAGQLPADVAAGDAPMLVTGLGASRAAVAATAPERLVALTAPMPAAWAAAFRDGARERLRAIQGEDPARTADLLDRFEAAGW